MWQFIKKFIARIIYSIPIWLLVVLGILAALQTTTVQTYLAQHAAQYLSDKVGYPIQVKYLNVRWPDFVVLREVSILDKDNSPMIEAGELQVDFDWATLIDGKNIYLNEVILKNAKLKLAKRKNIPGLNIDGFIVALDKLVNPPRRTKRIGPAPIFQINHVWLNNVQFSFTDERQDSIRNGFDYYHFNIDSIQAMAHRLRFVADTIETQIESLYGQDNHTHLDIHRLATDFRYTKKNIQLANLKLDIGNSTIREFITFNYNSPADMSDFVEKVNMSAKFSETRIYSKDLALFAPYLNRYEEYWSASGNFTGKVKRFRFRNADIRFGQNSIVRGNISFEGLPDFKETLIDFDLKPSVLVTSDLQQYLDDASYSAFHKFGTVQLSGKFLGFPQDFVANGTFQTSLGTLVSDINLKISPNEAHTYYKGHLRTQNFDIGKLSDQPKTVQFLDMDGEIEGTGLKLEDADFTLKADISRIGYKFYDYKRINIDGQLSRQLFKGAISIKDTNLVFDASGEIDLRHNKDILNIQTNLQKANLYALKLVPSELVIRGKMDINTHGLELDKLVGDAVLTDGYVLYQNKDLIIDSLVIHSEKTDNQRLLQVHSDFVNLKAEGNFDFTRLAVDVRQLLEEYRLNFSNNAAEIKNYYSRKTKQVHPRYKLDYTVDLININPVLLMFYPDVYVSANTTLEGSFSKGRTAMLSLHSAFDTLTYKNATFYGNEVDLNTSKLSDSTIVLASTYLHSKRQNISNTQSENLALEAIWNGKHIEFSGKIQQSNSPNYADLRGDADFLSDRIELKFRPSHLQAFKNEWHINSENLVTIKGREITFDSLQFSNRYQAISLDGSLSDDTTKVAKISLHEFGLQSLNPLVGRDLLGTANGFISIKDFYKNRSLESQITIEEMVVDKFLVGDVVGDALWNAETKKINVNYQIYRMDQRIVRVYGTYDPRSTDEALNMNVVLDRANLELLEPFFRSQVSSLGGTVSGTLTLTGMLTSPYLKGEANVYNGRFRYNYLNTSYYFDDKVYFSRNEIGVKNLQLRDEDDNVATVSGGIFHDGFRNFVLSLSARMKSFKVLNTTEKENELFYGTAYVTGSLELFGAVENLNIQANARSNKGTNISIPISNKRTISQQEYIKFVSQIVPQKDLHTKNTRPEIDLSGVRMDFNFDITPDAYCKIIFDEKAGDFIRGNGSGQIKMEIDTKGDFRMFGNYAISEGAYNFTLLNALNKAFKIEPGGTISWSGDPYSGVLNIKAVHTQLTSILPIINDPTAKDNAEARRKYPVAVIMTLQGNLLSPSIDLAMDFKNFPQNSPYYVNVMEFKNRLLSNEQELNRQAFSLLILQRLSAENTFNGGGSIVQGNISEFLANQLSYWVSQVDENLEIDLNLSGIDSESWNAFQLRLSYAALDGRLRITRDGGFTTVQNTTSAVSVIGDWTVEYLLNKDGSLRIKMFNRNSQNIFNNTNLGATTGVVAGFSLLHTESFNTLREFFHRKKEDPKTEPDGINEAQPQVQAPKPSRLATEHPK